MARLLPCMIALLLACACSDLDAHSGTYRGGIVGSGDEECEPDAANCSFIRRGFPAGTQIVLEGFVPPPLGTRGTLTTTAYDAFEETPLELVTPVEHDTLSQYDFPGGNRIRNYIFAARPTEGPLAGRDPLVFVSLMEEDTIEVRVIVGSGDENRGDHFGLFVLEKE